MSTASYIVVEKSDGKCYYVYCHSDGHPSWNGKILKEYYNSQKKAGEVVSLGDLSSLSKSMECPKGHSFKNNIDGYSVAYGRDRGDTEDTEVQVRDDIDNVLSEAGGMIDYVYFWNNGEWFVKDMFKRVGEKKYGFFVLTDKIINEK